jgi:hypothetical protein
MDLILFRWQTLSFLENIKLPLKPARRPSFLVSIVGGPSIAVVSLFRVANLECNFEVEKWTLSFLDGTSYSKYYYEGLSSK